MTMRPGKIGILYANNMVRDNGYISEEDIIKAYLECSFEADEYDDELTFPNAIRTSFAKKYLIIRQITKESCPSIFEELNQLGVWHIFVLGDDASIIFNDFLALRITSSFKNSHKVSINAFHASLTPSNSLALSSVKTSSNIFNSFLFCNKI